MILIRGGRILDPASGTDAAQDILLDGPRIARTGPSLSAPDAEILDATGLTKGQKFYLYTPQLDHLSNDAENFGGLMTEVNICSSVDPQTKACTNI